MATTILHNEREYERHLKSWGNGNHHAYKTNMPKDFTEAQLNTYNLTDRQKKLFKYVHEQDSRDFYTYLQNMCILTTAHTIVDGKLRQDVSDRRLKKEFKKLVSMGLLLTITDKKVRRQFTEDLSSMREYLINVAIGMAEEIK